MFPATCGECGGHVTASRAAFAIEVRRERVDVQGVEHGRCESCGEVYLDASAMRAAQRQAVDGVRATHGLMTSDEIRALRATLGVSQAGLEQILGTGPKTVVRWETGTVVQGATADRLMRLLAVRPELAAVLASGPQARTAPASKGTRAT